MAVKKGGQMARKFRVILGQVLLALLLSWPLVLPGQEIEVIKSPQPNMQEPGYTRPEIVAEIPEEVAKDEFLFGPIALVIDNEGNHYLFDYLRTKVIVLDKQFKFLRSWGGSKGQGPGDFSGQLRGYEMQLGPDGDLYIADLMKNSIQRFDRAGGFKEEYKDCIRPRKAWFVGLDKESKQAVFFISVSEEMEIQVVDSKDRVMFKAPFKVKKRYLFNEPLFQNPNRPRRSVQTSDIMFSLSMSMQVAVFKNNRLVILDSDASTVHVLKDGRHEKSFEAWPKDAIFSTAKLFNERKDPGMFATVFYKILIDSFDDDHFFLRHTRSGNEEYRDCLYKFTLSGELVEVISVSAKERSERTKFMFVHQGRFYALNDDNKVLIMEVKK